MAFRTWGRLLLTALGVSVLAGAGQLGIAYGFGIVRLTGAFTGATVNQWPAQLVWVGWFSANAAVVGAVLTERLARRDGPPATTGRQLAVGAVAALGASTVAPLCMQPARAAELVSVDPVFAVGICAVLGAIVGAGAAIAVLLNPPLGWNVAAVAGAVWLLALVSALPSLGASGPLRSVRLGVLEPTWLDADAAQRLSLLLLPIVALLAGAASAGLARRRGHVPLVSGATGVAGPVLAAFAYLTAGPGDAVDRYQTTPYYGALIAVAAGALGAAAAALLRWPAGTRSAGAHAIEPSDILRPLPAGPALPTSAATTAAATSADRPDEDRAEPAGADVAARSGGTVPATGAVRSGGSARGGVGGSGGVGRSGAPAHWDWPEAGTHTAHRSSADPARRPLTDDLPTAPLTVTSTLGRPVERTAPATEPASATEPAPATEPVSAAERLGPGADRGPIAEQPGQGVETASGTARVAGAHASAPALSGELAETRRADPDSAGRGADGSPSSVMPQSHIHASEASSPEQVAAPQPVDQGSTLDPRRLTDNGEPDPQPATDAGTTPRPRRRSTRPAGSAAASTPSPASGTPTSTGPASGTGPAESAGDPKTGNPKAADAPEQAGAPEEGAESAPAPKARRARKARSTSKPAALSDSTADATSGGTAHAASTAAEAADRGTAPTTGSAKRASAASAQPIGADPAAHGPADGAATAGRATTGGRVRTAGRARTAAGEPQVDGEPTGTPAPAADDVTSRRDTRPTADRQPSARRETEPQRPAGAPTRGLPATAADAPTHGLAAQPAPQDPATATAPTHGLPAQPALPDHARPAWPVPSRPAPVGDEVAREATGVPASGEEPPPRARHRAPLPDLNRAASWEALATARRAGPQSTGPRHTAQDAPLEATASAGPATEAAAADTSAEGSAEDQSGADQSAGRGRGRLGLFRRNRSREATGSDAESEPLAAQDEEYVDWVTGLGRSVADNEPEQENGRRSLRSSGRHHRD
ncbi:hypothetical protein [Micromonospora costi]|uniref:Uncharacterized protein n=1 Tax=Micromonospora costi TaxID=1530042 RepID=A0A3B0A2V3_9ACTN|nr:hypothetical protein [Micromonospora costi]RKN54649.1 hypothetical protein D7193_19165 [Micromonospora costi]